MSKNGTTVRQKAQKKILDAEKMRRFSLRLKPDLLETVQLHAAMEGRSVNDMLNEVVADYLGGGDCRCCGKPL